MSPFVNNYFDVRWLKQYCTISSMIIVESSCGSENHAYFFICNLSLCTKAKYGATISISDCRNG